jgi:hypothetical protein
MDEAVNLPHQKEFHEQLAKLTETHHNKVCRVLIRRRKPGSAGHQD